MTSVKEDYNKKSKDIFKLLNDFRKNPKSLSKHLEGLKKYIDKSKVLTEPGKIPIQMVEGEEVIDEAINFLSGLKSLPPFELDPYLCESANEHVNDIGPKGLLSYQSSDGTEPEDRIGKYGNYVEALGENIDFGPNDAIGVIVSLTLDDGEEDRPHRDNLFKSDYRKVGIACGPHKTEYQMCVMDFAYDFVPHNNDQPKYNEVEKLSKDLKNNKPVENNFNVNVEQNTISNQRNEPKQQYSQNKPESSKYNNVNQSPIVPVNIDKQDGKHSDSRVTNNQVHQNFQNIQSPSIDTFNEISNINSKKRVVSKFVEVTVKTIVTYEDGSKKESVETENHTFK